MKRTYHIIIASFIILIGFNSSMKAQDFRDVLGTVYLTQSSQAAIIKMSYDQLNKELIDMTDINFSREIRAAKKEKVTIAVNDDQEILKAKYLKILRASANSTEDINSFYNKVFEKIPDLENILIDETILSKLYIKVRKNTLHGKLDKVGGDLTWL